MVDDEGCLSLAGVQMPVERPVSVSSRDAISTAASCASISSDLAARVVQHELDHLDGVLILDRTTDEARKEALAVLRPKAVLSAVVRLAVAATGKFGADVLAELAARREIEYVLTRPDRPKGRGRKPSPPPAKEMAQRLEIPGPAARAAGRARPRSRARWSSPTTER